MARVSTAIISYGGTSLPSLGRVRLRVWRDDFSRVLDCNLVDNKQVTQAYTWQETLSWNGHHQEPISLLTSSSTWTMIN